MTIQNSLFPEWCINDTSQETQQTIKVQRQSNFGLEYCADAFFCGKYGIPQIRSYTGPYPENYVTFNEMGKAGDYSTCVTFFNEDYILERFWANPDRYIDIMKTYMCATQPDFSLKINTPFCVQVANKYRNHALAYKMQVCGIRVIPSPSWSDSTSYDFCFEGYERGGIVIVSALGIYRDERSIRYFKNGFFEMLKRISPDSVIISGEETEMLRELIPSQLDVRFVLNNRYIRLRNYGR